MVIGLGGVTEEVTREQVLALVRKLVQFAHFWGPLGCAWYCA